MNNEQPAVKRGFWAMLGKLWSATYEVADGLENLAASGNAAARIARQTAEGYESEAAVERAIALDRLRASLPTQPDLQSLA